MNSMTKQHRPILTKRQVVKQHLRIFILVFIGVLGRGTFNPVLGEGHESLPSALFFRVEGGLTLGAYMPEVTPMPVEIREVDQFTPVGGGHLGLRAMYRPKASLFSYFVTLGLKHQGMETNTRVKNYSTSVRVEDNSINGYWTGEVYTHCEFLNLGLSPGVNYRISQSWSAEVGLYVGASLYTNFSGYVHEGYLRDKTPLGTKISFQGDKHGDYDFSSDLQTWHYVTDIALCYERKHDSPWQFYVQYDYTMNGLFNEGFNVVNYNMHGRFLNFGVSYLLYAL